MEGQFQPQVERPTDRTSGPSSPNPAMITRAIPLDERLGIAHGHCRIETLAVHRPILRRGPCPSRFAFWEQHSKLPTLVGQRLLLGPYPDVLQVSPLKGPTCSA